MPRFNAVETRYRSTLYSTAVLNLNCSVVFFFKSFFIVLLGPKEPKAPAHGKISQPLLCSGAALRHPSVKKALSAKPVIRFLGDADLPQLATAYSGI